MQLSVVIVNYNVKYFLEQVLHSVRKASKNLDVEVFMVDNNSVDDSVEMVREKFPEVIVIANKKNVGFSVANNQAIKRSKGKYSLLLNPDTVVEEDTFKKCIAFMDAHPDAGGLGVKMIDGKGNFLPESKRGFPSPLVAFYKTFGLSKVFPKSKRFNQYHLGHLDPNENHEVEVLAGAFMMLRKSVLDEIGLLDETFFMYGEDIDLSYRIVKAGYKNYYFADTRIIHYKGESTKKGSLNYVTTFYNAMIIFARKHFKGEKARLFILMLKSAIYLRAGITLISNFLKRIYLPLIDSAVLFGGLILIKNFWANYRYNSPDYFADHILYINFPLYIVIWIGSIYFSGGYDRTYNFGKIIRGLFIGTVLIAAVYGFLNTNFRSSRMLILFGTAWAGIAMVGLRMIYHLIKYGNSSPDYLQKRNLVIVGHEDESDRVLNLLRKAEVYDNFIGRVHPDEDAQQDSLGNIYQMAEIVHIYQINEIIFCSQDISSQEIIHWMSELGPEVDYKIVPEKGLSIIGSNSRDTAGDLYTIEVSFDIDSQMSRRNKRLTDVLLALCFLILSPILILFLKTRLNFFPNIFKVLIGQLSWAGYYPLQNGNSNLPKIKPSVLSPLDALRIQTTDKNTIKRLNLLYAKDYTTYRELEIIRKGWRFLGRKKHSPLTKTSRKTESVV